MDKLEVSIPLRRLSRLQEIVRRHWNRNRKTFTAGGAAQLIGNLLSCLQRCHWLKMLLFTFQTALQQALRNNASRLAHSKHFQAILAETHHVWLEADGGSKDAELLGLRSKQARLLWRCEALTFILSSSTRKLPGSWSSLMSTCRMGYPGPAQSATLCGAMQTGRSFKTPARPLVPGVTLPSCVFSSKCPGLTSDQPPIKFATPSTEEATWTCTSTGWSSSLPCSATHEPLRRSSHPNIRGHTPQRFSWWWTTKRQTKPFKKGSACSDSIIAQAVTKMFCWLQHHSKVAIGSTYINTHDNLFADDLSRAMLATWVRKLTFMSTNDLFTYTMISQTNELSTSIISYRRFLPSVDLMSAILGAVLHPEQQPSSFPQLSAKNLRHLSDANSISINFSPKG
jgi:hypothetical protein